MLKYILSKISNIIIIIFNRFFRNLGFELRETIKKDIYQLQLYHERYPKESRINKRFNIK